MIIIYGHLKHFIFKCHHFNTPSQVTPTTASLHNSNINIVMYGKLKHVILCFNVIIPPPQVTPTMQPRRHYREGKSPSSATCGPLAVLSTRCLLVTFHDSFLFVDIFIYIYFTQLTHIIVYKLFKC